MTPTHGPTDAERAQLRRVISLSRHGRLCGNWTDEALDDLTNSMLALLAGLRERIHVAATDAAARRLEVWEIGDAIRDVPLLPLPTEARR